jgi:glyoxylase-like metal-dependent hydrolase (beta-lactamase superfamily II)
MGLVIETFEDIGITRVSRWIFNCYIIHRGEQGPIVVDPGLPGAIHDLVPVMTELGLELDERVAVCATHAHSDHVAGAPALASRTCGTVHLPGASQAYLNGTRPRSPSLRAIARIWPTVFDQPIDRRGVADAARGAKIAGYGTKAGMRWPERQPVEFLLDGDHLPGAPEWEVISAPGHSDDSTAFWHERTQTLLSGDAVLSVGGRAWITPETVDDEASAKTSARLRQLDVNHLLPGHGRPVHGVGVMAAALLPSDGPNGFTTFPGGLLRCLSGRVGSVE